MGQAGTGKSRAIHMMREITQEKCNLSSIDEKDTDAITCLIQASTDRAAFNVDGLTIHCALKLPLN